MKKLIIPGIFLISLLFVFIKAAYAEQVSADGNPYLPYLICAFILLMGISGFMVYRKASNIFHKE